MVGRFVIYLKTYDEPIDTDVTTEGYVLSCHHHFEFLLTVQLQALLCLYQSLILKCARDSKLQQSFQTRLC